jgi:pimeloyl-ACP methyl ester carboxylesterase
MSTADVNGISINYRLEGDGAETVVLVNGLADELESWGYQTPALVAAGYRVLTFDNRGVGESDKPAGPYTTRLFAEDTKALVDSLDLRAFHLVGVSMGGMIAQEYALAYPGDLRSLLLACTYAAPGPFCSRMFALWEEMAPVMGLKSVMQDVTLWAFTQEFFETRPDELAEFEEAMATLTMPIDAYLAQLSSIQTHDATARLGEITAATTVVAGEIDILIPVELSRRLHQGIAGSEFVTVPGGHACAWEHPDSFNEAVIAHVRKHSS